MYEKRAFDAPSLEAAKNTVLSEDPNKPNKFKEETDLLIKVFKSFNIFADESKVLDYGCGMGRVSKQIINTFNSSVIGLDQSMYMLKYAKSYVPTNFEPVIFYSVENSIDICISILALQHSEFPKNDLDVIYKVLKPGGYFILCNEPTRLVPVGIQDNYVQWNDDGINIEKLALNRFIEVERSYDAGDLPIILYKKG